MGRQRVITRDEMPGWKKNYTLEAITNHGRFYYQLDNSGAVDVSADLQKIFNDISALEDVSASLIFAPGVLQKQVIAKTIFTDLLNLVILLRLIHTSINLSK